MPQYNIKNIIAKNIKYFREYNHLSKKAVAEYLGVSASSVTHWEDGSNSIDINKLSNLCELFNCNISDMVNIDDKFSFKNLILTEDEKQLVKAYRAHPEMRLAINKILDINF